MERIKMVHLKTDDTRVGERIFIKDERFVYRTPEGEKYEIVDSELFHAGYRKLPAELVVEWRYSVREIYTEK